MLLLSRGLLLTLFILVLFGQLRATAQSLPDTLPPPLAPGVDPNTLQFPSGQQHSTELSSPELLSSELLESVSPYTQPLFNETIQQSVLQADVIESAPVQEQHQIWYRQYPWMWMSWDGWVNSVEFGLNGSSGNSDTTSIQTGADLQRITDIYTLSVDLDYQKTQASGTETQNNARLNVDFDRLLGSTCYSAFSKFGLEYDEFKIFDLRVNINGGLGYYWLRDERSTLVTRFGAGASQEIGSPIDDWVAEAVFGYEASHQMTTRQKLKGKMEYFPEWGDFGNYRIVSDVSWEILLDGTDNLSLKLAATDRFDSTPQGAKRNDVFYSMLLLWKF